ncbi:uncharacterized protein LOC126462778 [Schistocerca serialis cubense]|uniref:uncharacterized protein LOC126462778 n=1 Tax=Schistocerca serialis cubense TaxID=2023355 RepID=UPI00214F435D|nr:uncharacterized protein LOC126462778 [Schistocerca serialis cubense]
MSTRNSKACDPDDIYSEHLKTAFPVLVIPLTALLNECLKREIVPDQWKHSNVTIPSMGKGNKAGTNSYRSIALQNTLFKTFTTLLCKRLRDIIDEKLPDSQFGFRCGRSTAQAVHCLQTYIEMALANRWGKLHAIFVDFSKSFDAISRSIPVKKLETSLVPRHYLLPVVRDLHFFFMDC